MSMAVAEALVEAGARPLDQFMAAVAKRFVEWRDSPDNFRSPGITTMLACAALKEGRSWKSSGAPNSKGCGSVMRTAPVGFFYSLTPERLKETARAVGLATHAHPTADAACLGAARAASLACEDAPPRDWLPAVRAFTAGISAEFDATLSRVDAALTMPDEERAVAWIGERFHGWTADEVLGIALFSVLRHPASFRDCVLRAVNNSGDSDSIGCVAGGLQGARLGAAAIPASWLEGLERRRDLLELAERLAAARAANHRP
jgi:ADP-ribosylglycohydrolase